MSFMNSDIPQTERKTRDVKSIWSDARLSLKAVSLSLDLSVNSATLSLVNGSVITAERVRGLNSYLRTHLRNEHLQTLVGAPDQGRSFHLASKSPSSNYWLTSGQYCSFAEYRFAIKARCNLLPVNSVLARMKKRGQQPTTCRICHSSPETLGHVLNSCTPHVGLMRSRHNTILERIRKAVPENAGTLLIDQKIPGSPGQLRPDITLMEADRVSIIDVTIPYESGPDAFEKARAEKEGKYSELVEWARSKFKEVCRCCSKQPESLGHVLNACTLATGLMRERHNAILERLRKALKMTQGTLLVDQKIPSSPLVSSARI